MSDTRDGKSFMLFLGGLSGLGPMAIDMGLPGLPAIESEISHAAGQGALVLSVFLAGFSVAPIVCGPLADRFGRRALLIGGMSLFAIAAALFALSSSWTLLLAARLLQGFAAGACAALPVAILRDLYTGPAARSRMAQVVSVQGIAPIAAPVLGGMILLLTHWRAIYVVQAILGLLLLLYAIFLFRESLPADMRRPLHPAALAETYAMVLKDAGLRRHALIYGFAFACMFTYIAAAANAYVGQFGMSETLFAVVFAASSMGIVAGAQLNARLTRRGLSGPRLIRSGLGLMLASVLAINLLNVTGGLHVAALAVLAGLVVFSFGLLASAANHEALLNLGHVAGAASGVMRCLQMLLGSLASAASVVLPAGITATSSMALLMLAMAILACLAGWRYERK